MDEQELIDRIRLEEKIRHQIQKEFAAERSEPKMTFWKLLNSNFGLFLLSSIVLTFISWSYSQIQSHNQQKAEHIRITKRLSAEMKYRMILLDNKMQTCMTISDSLRIKPMWDVNDIFYGRSVALMNGVSRETEFDPVFPEYDNRGVVSLFWEYAMINLQGDNTQFIEPFMAFQIGLRDMMDNDSDTTLQFPKNKLLELNNHLDKMKKAIQEAKRENS
ncbi:MAG: hypothetical protein GC181_10595 [Bacteroidetes bacterium]|nr:hypothetical protein [Bacteroidota bacterium]